MAMRDGKQDGREKKHTDEMTYKVILHSIAVSIMNLSGSIVFGIDRIQPYAMKRLKHKHPKRSPSQFLNTEPGAIRLHRLQFTMSHHQGIGITLLQFANQSPQRNLLRLSPGILRTGAVF